MSNDRQDIPKPMNVQVKELAKALAKAQEDLKNASAKNAALNRNIDLYTEAYAEIQQDRRRLTQKLTKVKDERDRFLNAVIEFQDVATNIEQRLGLAPPAPRVAPGAVEDVEAQLNAQILDELDVAARAARQVNANLQNLQVNNNWEIADHQLEGLNRILARQEPAQRQARARPNNAEVIRQHRATIELYREAHRERMRQGDEGMAQAYVREIQRLQRRIDELAGDYENPF